MATLDFKGKNIIWNHHLSVPYHTLDLDEKLSFNKDKADGNLIIEGDNLPALKSLLPQYTGKIKCIYIDPPYNTGEENWIYNDSVNSPLINEWIGKIVDKDDLTRHDKWLTMMTPRLKLLRELLSNDGVIFISIDDNEANNLKCLMNEIYEERNFVAQIIWSRKRGRDNSAKFFSKSHEYIIVYAKNIDVFNLQRLKMDESTELAYKNPDNDDRGTYRALGCWARGTQNGPKYEFTSKEGKVFSERMWLFNKANLERLDNENRLVYVGDKVYRKLFRSEHTGQVPETLWDEVSNAANASDEIKEIFGNQLFDTPKPTPLIKRIVAISTKDNDLILDAFAGSGTTGQAVLQLNEEDKGNRKFIMVQMSENSEKEPNKNICKDITRERIVKVIQNKLTNKGVGFEYKKVGQQIDAETILSGKLPTFEQVAKYVFYLATGQTPKDKDINGKKYLAGKIDHTEVYLLYKQDMEELQQLALTFDWAKEISKGNSNKKIVYAPACFLDDEYMEKFNMKFVSIPYNLFERQK